MIWLLVLTVIGAALFTVGIVVSGHVREFHHAYAGLALALLALASVVPLWLGWLGIAVLLEDAAQHLIQMDDPEYRSPLHLAYRRFVYEPWRRLRR